MTLTLTDFLLARIAEDEAAAGESLRATRREAVSLRPTDGQATTSALSYMEFIVRWPPARVLAECEAKRAVVGLHPEMLGWCQGCAHESYPCRTLLALALPYADHPDYDPSWAA